METNTIALKIVSFLNYILLIQKDEIESILYSTVDINDLKQQKLKFNGYFITEKYLYNYLKIMLDDSYWKHDMYFIGTRLIYKLVPTSKGFIINLYHKKDDVNTVFLTYRLGTSLETTYFLNLIQATLADELLKNKDSLYDSHINLFLSKQRIYSQATRIYIPLKDVLSSDKYYYNFIVQENIQSEIKCVSHAKMQIDNTIEITF